jgi:4-hydroxy-tetrahydrodipicolinate synthase
MKPLFSGSATALVTPFIKDSINFEAFENLIEFQIKNGTDALVILGTTGEPATMTEKERDDVVAFAIKKINGRVKTIIGSGSNCTAKAIEESKKAESMGADGLLVVTPYYNKCTQNGIYEYYKTVNDAVNIPFICYNVPARTGVNILPATMQRLADLKNIGGIKEACGNMEQICETARVIRGKTYLYSGDDNLNLPILAIGGEGLISVASNVVPYEVKMVYEYVKSRELDKAIELTDKLLPLIDAMFYEVNPIPAKAALNLIGLNGGLPRAPLTELEPLHTEQMIKALKDFGFKI